MSGESLVNRRLFALICLLIVSVFGAGCGLSIEQGPGLMPVSALASR